MQPPNKSRMVIKIGFGSVLSEGPFDPRAWRHHTPLPVCSRVGDPAAAEHGIGRAQLVDRLLNPCCPVYGESTGLVNIRMRCAN